MSLLYRTYSSPNLKGNRSKWEFQGDKFGYDDEEQDFYVIGDRVYVDGYRQASVAYFGEVDFASGDWVGVVLDNPTGNHDGRIHGRQYFQCAPMHGLFVRSSRVGRMPDSAMGSSASSSRISTPLPSFSHNMTGRSSSKSPASSLMESYIYDEDYRKPTVMSLEQKFKSISTKSDRNHRPPLRQSTPTAGILKKNSRSQSTEPRNSPYSSNSMGSSRIDDSFSQSRASSAMGSSASRSPVFHFRPQRTRLDNISDFHSTRQKSPNAKSAARVGLDLSTEPPCLGDRVSVRTELGEMGEMTGILRYLGETNFATGEWAGVELDEPAGKNDGSILGYRYFYCPKNYGLFVPATRVKKYRLSQSHSSLNKSDFKTMRSTITSPPPLSKQFTTSDYSGSLTHSFDRDLSSSHSSAYTPISPDYTSPLSKLASNYRRISKYKPEYNQNPLNSSQRSISHSSHDLESSFDELEHKLRRLTGNNWSDYDTSSNLDKAKAVKYTFTSSKYDGNPIVRRTIVYE